MKAISLHEIYVIPKVFRTIGFNEEGTYGLSIAVSTKRKNGKNTPAYLSQHAEISGSLK